MASVASGGSDSRTQKTAFGTVEDLVEESQQAGWRVDYLQLEKGKLDARYQTLDFGGIFLMAEHKYVTVVHAGGEVLIEEPLKSLEGEFGDRFLRVHRNALVALDRIVALEKDAAGHVLVRMQGSDRTLEVSRRNLPTVRKVMKTI